MGSYDQACLAKLAFGKIVETAGPKQNIVQVGAAARTVQKGVCSFFEKKNQSKRRQAVTKTDNVRPKRCFNTKALTKVLSSFDLILQLQKDMKQHF